MAWCVERGDGPLGHCTVTGRVMQPHHSGPPGTNILTTNNWYDTSRVIQPHRFSPGLPAQTFNFIQFKDACIACALCNDMWVSVQPAHLT